MKVFVILWVLYTPLDNVIVQQTNDTMTLYGSQAECIDRARRDIQFLQAFEDWGLINIKDNQILSVNCYELKEVLK